MSAIKKVVGMPDPFASNAVKESDAYGLEVAKVIQSEWFNGGVLASGCSFHNRRETIINKRLRVRGEQDTERYKTIMARQKGDLDYLNLDWRPLNYSGKYCNLVSNGIRDDYYRIDIRANDRLSVKMKSDKQNEHRKNMRSLPMLKKTKQLLGIDMIPKGFIPADEEELQLYMQINDKPKVEIAEELIIDYIKKTNRWENIENVKNDDLVQNGLAVSRIWTDPKDGVKIEEVDIENFGHSYVKKDDFSDAKYFFVLDNLTLNDIQRESGCEDKKIREIAKNCTTDMLDFEKCAIKELLHLRADVMRFSFYTTKKDVFKLHKRNGKTKKISKRNEDFNPPERADYGKAVNVRDTWFEGSFVLGSEFLYNYQECENLVKDELNKARPPFVAQATKIYKNKLHSFLGDIETIEDNIQLQHLKIQHLVSELKPDIIEIDEDQLAELTTEGDKKETWQEALNLLNVKGVIIKKRIDMGEMGVKDGHAARMAPSQQGSALAALLNTWQHYKNELREVTGINPARDGSLPSDALLGVNQMAQLASNTVTQHIVDAATNFNKRVAEVISTRVHRIFSSKQEGAKKLRDIYVRAVGKQNIDALEMMKNRHLHDFGFTVEMRPTSVEIQEFKENLNIALQNGEINVETKIEAEQIVVNNPKLANQYLIYKRRKKIEETRKNEEHRQKLQTESNIASGESAAQNQVKAYGLKSKIDLETEAKRAEIEVMKEKALQEIRKPREDEKFNQTAFLEKLKLASTIELAKYKEIAKDERLKMQSSHQSKLVDQRQNDKDPIDFENNFLDSIFSIN